MNGIPTFPIIEKDGKFFVELDEGALPKSVP
jgi:hypothetical protein